MTTRVDYVGQAKNPAVREAENLDKTTHTRFYPITLTDGVVKKMALLIEFFGIALYGESFTALATLRKHSFLVFQMPSESLVATNTSGTRRLSGGVRLTIFVKGISRRRWPSFNAAYASSALS